MPAPQARFDVLFKDQHVTEYALPHGRAVVGRTGDNDLQIRSRFISRHHMQIVTDNEKTVVEDLNSTNGMVIDGKRTQYRVMVDGDVIQLGEHKLVYRDLRMDPAEHTTPHYDDDLAHAETHTPADLDDPDEALSEAAGLEAEGFADAEGAESDGSSTDADEPKASDEDDEYALESEEEGFDSAKTRVLD